MGSIMKSYKFILSGRIFRQAVFLVAAMLSSVLPTWLHAQNRGISEPQAIYTVDVPKVLVSSIAGRAAQNNIEMEAKKSESRLEMLRQELEQLRSGILKQNSLLSEQALRDKREQLERKELEYQRAVQDERQDVERRNDTEMRKVMLQIQEVVEEISRASGYRIIIERDPKLVLYGSEKYDLTSQVIKKLNEKQI